MRSIKYGKEEQGRKNRGVQGYAYQRPWLGRA